MPQPNAILESNRPGLAIGDYADLTPGPPPGPISVKAIVNALPWQPFTFYVANQLVTNSGTTYIADVPHLSGASFAAGTNWSIFGSGGGGGGQSQVTTVVAVNTALAAAANTNYVYLASAGVTLTLPTAVGNTNLYTIKNTDTTALSLATTASQTIDGNAAPLSIGQLTSYTVASTGANWVIV